MFGDDRLRGFGVAGAQILAFPIDFDCRPYNTLARPCECVIIKLFSLALTAEALLSEICRYRRFMKGWVT